MKKTVVLLLLIFIYGNSIFSQNEFSETEKFASTSRIWGFLKYYHPEVSKGTFNWDEQLLEILPKVEKATTKEQLSQIYLDWIASLGEMKKCEKCNKPTNKVFFDKNFDLSWTQDNPIFTSELSKKLKFIENNRNQGQNYYVSSTKHSGNVIISNEPKYEKFEYPNEYYRLLCLFKYWNIIEYFFPYKYQTDQNWNKVLTEMIPKYWNAENATEYHLAILETVTKIDDSHTPIIYTKELGEFFGKYGIPVKYQIIDNKIVITDFRYKEVDKIDDLKIGDAILEINGVTIEKLMQGKSKYIPASNKKGKERNSFLILSGNEKQVSIKYERDGEISEKKINRYDFSTLQQKEPVGKDQIKWKIINEDIAYVKVGNIELNDVDNLMNSIIYSKAIILDIRDYPKGTNVMKKISRSLNTKREVFAKVVVPDLSYPGKYYWKKGKESGTNNKNYYKGKVIILVNGNTQSQSEYFAMSFQKAPNNTTIGNQTAGADGNVSQFELVGGFKTTMTGTGIFYPDGSGTQRKGVKIDIEVQPTIQGIKAGRDEILEKAIKFANE